MKPTVAVVEDDPDILELLGEILDVDGFHVTAFSRPPSPDECAGRFRDGGRKPSVFVIDLMLPGMTGIELASRLRESEFRDTPMIAMSASRLMLEMAAGSGLFDATVAKPFNLDTLVEAIEQYAGIQSVA